MPEMNADNQKGDSNTGQYGQYPSKAKFIKNRLRYISSLRTLSLRVDFHEAGSFLVYEIEDRHTRFNKCTESV